LVFETLKKDLTLLVIITDFIGNKLNLFNQKNKTYENFNLYINYRSGVPSLDAHFFARNLSEPSVSQPGFCP
jgi:hypothetical protein